MAAHMRILRRRMLYPSAPPQVLAQDARFPRLVLWWRRLGWRGRFIIVIAAVFIAMIAAPSAIAVVLYRRTESALLAWRDSRDGRTDIRVYDSATGLVNTMPLNEYLVGVLAAQMGPDTPPAALEAAAVAARTYALRAMDPAADNGRTTFARSHGADVTDSASLDLPWMSIAQQEDKFGVKIDVIRLRYQQAVLATDGLILTYQGKPILAFTFRVSPGVTRDAGKVFGKTLPYLPSVPCPDDAPLARQAAVRIATGDLQSALQIPGSVKPADFQIVGRDPWGFVKSVKYRNLSWSGQDFATLLGLSSANFTLQPDSSGLVVRCTGIGADIGMSLHEAVVQAQAGKSWQAILSYFYPGAKLELGREPVQRAGS